MADLAAAQILEAFEQEIARQQNAELNKAYAVLQDVDETAETPEDTDDSTSAVSPRRQALSTPESIDEAYRPAYDEIAASLAELISEDSKDVLDTMRYYRALCLQGDFIGRRRRADVLRLSSRKRRKVHAATRRRAHGIKGGLLERKYKADVLRELGGQS